MCAECSGEVVDTPIACDGQQDMQYMIYYGPSDFPITANISSELYPAFRSCCNGDMSAGEETPYLKILTDVIIERPADIETESKSKQESANNSV